MRIGGLAPPLLNPGIGLGADRPFTAFHRLSQYRLANERVQDIRRAVLDVQRLLGRNPIGLVTPGGTAGSVELTGDDLGLSPLGTRSTLTATAEVNAATTSIADRSLDWPGNTNAYVTIDGTYDGSLGDTTFWLETKLDKKSDPTTLPTSAALKFEVHTPAGKDDQFAVQDEAMPFTYTWRGLTITLHSGEVHRKDTSESIGLSATTGSVFDPAKPFDGIGDDDAVLEDPFTIVDGSFTINGDVVAVNASDSLQDVMDRINNGAYDVSVAYDPGTERLTFTHDQYGPLDIDLADDTSGFLAAMKLTGAATNLGVPEDDRRPIDQVPSLSSVVDGTITVNGVDIDVDTQVDSLREVVDQMNAVAGVTVVLEDGRIKVTGDQGQQVTLADTTGLLAVSGIPTGTQDPPQATDGGIDAGLSTELSRRVAKAMRKLANAVDAFLVDQLPGPRLAPSISRLRSSLATEFGSVFELEDGTLKALGGMRFTFTDDRDRGVRATLSNERKLARLLDEGDRDTLVALIGDNGDEPGILERLDDWTRANIAGLRDAIVGTRVDVYA